MQLTLLGTGNVANALGTAFFEAGHSINQVYGRKKEAAKKLAKKLNSEGTDNLEKLKPGSDVYLFCVSDDAIEKVAKEILLKDIFCVHTSGAMSIDILKKKILSVWSALSIANNFR